MQGQGPQLATSTRNFFFSGVLLAVSVRVCARVCVLVSCEIEIHFKMCFMLENNSDYTEIQRGITKGDDTLQLQVALDGQLQAPAREEVPDDFVAVVSGPGTASCPSKPLPAEMKVACKQ